jgi:hypothetical protein
VLRGLGRAAIKFKLTFSLNRSMVALAKGEFIVMSAFRTTLCLLGIVGYGHRRNIGRNGQCH